MALQFLCWQRRACWRRKAPTGSAPFGFGRGWRGALPWQGRLLILWILTVLALWPILNAPALRAEERALSAGEIALLLTGNTAQGEHNGPTRQFFDPSGLTLYQGQGEDAQVGKWRIEPETDRYCSLWPGGTSSSDADDWNCYSVLSDGQHFYWYSPNLGEGEFRVPFVIVKGKQMNFN